MDSRLLNVLQGVGQEPLPLSFSDGSEILVLPYGGRILGLFAPDDSRNFLWTNPALENVETAREFYASRQWPNSGGDRTWLAPEIEFFFPHYPDITTYVQPSALDPGSYQAEISETEIRMAMEFSLTPKSAGQEVRLRLAKTVRAAANPLGSREDAPYAGYELHTTLEALSPLSSGIGLWSLLQMPFGGEMIVPTYGAAKPLVVFGQPPPGHVAITEHFLRYRMVADGDHKISLPARCSTGRVGYLYENGEETHLIVRNFFVNPSGEYVDASWTDPCDRGYGVQACSANGVFGRFSELEYHVPAMTPETPFSRDVSQVWAYRGSRAQIGQISRQLLGVPV